MPFLPQPPQPYTRPVVWCPTCGEQNSDTARFCQSCGSPLVRAAPAPEERKVVSILFVDLVVVPNVELGFVRNITAVAAMMVLLFGLVWERQ